MNLVVGLGELVQVEVGAHPLILGTTGVGAARRGHARLYEGLQQAPVERRHVHDVLVGDVMLEVITKF